MAAVIESFSATQSAEHGDHGADAVLHLSTGRHYRGHVELREGVAACYQRLVAYAGGDGSTVAETVGRSHLVTDQTDGGTSEIPVLIALDAIAVAHLVGAGQ